MDNGADITVIGLNHLHFVGVLKETLQRPMRNFVGPDKHNFKCQECFTATLRFGSRK